MEYVVLSPVLKIHFYCIPRVCVCDCAIHPVCALHAVVSKLRRNSYALLLILSC